jgi:hypothetical protein
MKTPKFFYWRSDKNQQWYFSLHAPNGKTIAQSEGYKTERGCLNGIASVRTNANKAKIVYKPLRSGLQKD